MVAIFLIAAMSAFIVALLGGLFIAPAKVIASNLSPAFYVAGMAVALAQTKQQISIPAILVGAVGGVAGWFAYRVIVLYVLRVE